MKNRDLIILILIFTTLFSSCVSRKKLTYLQFSDMTINSIEQADSPRASVVPAAYKVLPYDNLYIRVITPDPQWSAIFNTMPVGAGGAVTEESASLFGYSVDNEGYIEIPFVGKIAVGGKTLTEIKGELASVFENYVTDAAITIKLVNNFVTILGEVDSPGKYPITKDRINVFEALAMAGDLSAYASRQRIQLIRPSPYGPIVKEFSLLDRRILSSELYYLMPNDVIYAIPTTGRSFQLNSSVWVLFLTTITSALSITALVRTL